MEVAIEEVVELMSTKTEAKGLELILRFAPNTPTHIIGDPGRIRQVIMNFISNSIKFTEKGYILLNVECSKQDDDYADFNFMIKDTGIGIPANKLPEIFNKFTQADTSTTRKYGGTGLGLAISKQLAELMGGSVGVKSEIGVGSEFYFNITLPKDKEPLTTQQTDIELTGLKILIVDDNAVNRRILEELMSNRGILYESCGSGQEALTILKQAHARDELHQLAVLDHYMPDMDGIELAQAIKADSDIQDIVLVMLSSSSYKIDIETQRNIGFAGQLSKPFRPRVLMKILAAAWASRRYNIPGQFVTKHWFKEVDTKVRDFTTDTQKIPAKVLLVEDDLVNQKVAMKMLVKMGCHVDLAINGLESVELTTKNSYDVVFMDCQMPIMDGFEATSQIRKNEGKQKHTPIIALTANAMKEDKKRCVNAGMDNYLPKPVKKEALREMILMYFAPESSMDQKNEKRVDEKSIENSR
jgi:CheY-like chemotaxis protein